MFTTPELGALLVEAPLSDPSSLDREPDVVRLVFPPDVLTILGVGLDVPAIVIVTLDPLDMGPLLTGHVPPDIVLERTRLHLPTSQF
jgi:hypothetical protein